MIDVLRERTITLPNLVGLSPNNHTIDVPTLDRLHKDVRTLAGYEVTGRAILGENSIVIRGKFPGKRGLPVVMKISRTFEDSGHARAQREFVLLDAAGRVARRVPRAIELRRVRLHVGSAKVGTPATASEIHAKEYSLLVQEEIAGDDFRQEIETKERETKRPFKRMKLVRRLDPAADAIDAFGMRLGIIHRDVKPANMVGIQLHVVDFGAAMTEREEAQVTWGTIGYMPIEQMIPNVRLTHAANVYGFGATLLRANGISLLPGDINEAVKIMSDVAAYDANLDKKLDGVPIPVQGVYRRVVAWRPEDRYDSCTEALEDLARATTMPERTIIYQAGR